MQSTVKKESAKRELYDVDEYKAKMDVAIQKIWSRPPGAATGKVGKNVILGMYKEDFKKMLASKYTAIDIAVGIKDNVFGILPKTITQLMKDSNAKKSAKAVRTTNKRTTTPKTTMTTVVDKALEQSATFTIKKDEKL